MAVTVLLSALARASPAPQFGNGEMDLTELMNKFLAEYDGGKGNNNDFEQHQEEISYEPEPHMYGEAPQYYRPPQHQQHNQYQQQQEYFNQPERQHQQQQYKQQYHGGQRHPEAQSGPSPHSQEQAAKVDTEKRQSAGPASSSAAPEQKQVTKVESVKQAAEEQEEDVDPKLRDFTLIISKLLFQLSQL